MEQVTYSSNNINNKCRFCLQGENLRNDNEDYYVENLKEIFNLMLISNSRLPWRICATCETFVDAAKGFRDMVMSAERQLLQALINNFCDAESNEKCLDNLNVKEDPIDEESNGRGYEDEGAMFETSENVASHDEETTAIENESPHKSDAEDETGPENKIKNSTSNENSDSDTPVHLKENYYVKVNLMDRNANDYSTKEIEQNIQNTNILDPTPEPTPHNTLIHSEESFRDKRHNTDLTKIRENIILILKHSTILPFRHRYLNKYICYYCKDTFTRMEELRNHTETRHVGQVNDKTLMSWMRKQSQRFALADISVIKCRLCNKEVTTVEALIEHLTETHKKVYHNMGKSNCILGFILSSDELKCHLCKEKFDRFNQLSTHINDHYGAFICHVCGKKFAVLGRYTSHTRIHETRVKEFKCDYCNSIFKTRVGIRGHIQKHLKTNLSLKCEKCPKTFPFMHYKKRKTHMIKVHGVKTLHNFKCDVCKNDKTYASEDSLRNHKKTIHRIGDYPHFECKICGYSAVRSKVFRDHMDVHNGVKNYECDYCGKKFGKRNTLIWHIRVHVNDKRFKCPMCESAFVQKYSLQYVIRKL